MTANFTEFENLTQDEIKRMPHGLWNLINESDEWFMSRFDNEFRKLTLKQIVDAYKEKKKIRLVIE